jgi:hypothetical protein
MKTYIVYAERTVLETLEVEATSEDEALAKAMEADNDEWQTDSDIDWQITNAREADDDEDADDDTYDAFGVNTKNSFNTPPKGESK